MDEAILNSLLRYSKQITPARDTYPIPSKEWTGGLRGTEPQVNLSTYYLFDNPSLASTPFKPQNKISGSVSTSAISPQKRFSTASPIKKDFRTEQQKKIAETEGKIRKSIEKEEAKRANFEKKKKIYSPVKKEIEEKKLAIQEEGIRKEFEEYKLQQAELVQRMQEEIIFLRKKLQGSTPLDTNSS